MNHYRHDGVLNQQPLNICPFTIKITVPFSLLLAKSAELTWLGYCILFRMTILLSLESRKQNKNKNKNIFTDEHFCS